VYSLAVLLIALPCALRADTALDEAQARRSKAYNELYHRFAASSDKSAAGAAKLKHEIVDPADNEVRRVQKEAAIQAIRDTGATIIQRKGRLGAADRQDESPAGTQGLGSSPFFKPMGGDDSPGPAPEALPELSFPGGKPSPQAPPPVKKAAPRKPGSIY
jgi:hypothetical protein